MTDKRGRIFVAVGIDAPRPELPFVERDAITAIVRDRRTRKYLILRWKKADWVTFITGGIEKGQTGKDAARAEVHQETGYKNLRLVAELPRFQSKFYHRPKGENRFGHFQAFLFELINHERDRVSEAETAEHEPELICETDLGDLRLPEGHRYLIDYVLERGL
jgi:8-oxo-dGTP pyrophosphatase MutT (NUDIX family)